MKIQGKRVKRTRLVRTDDFVVAVDVEAVIPLDDPSEPCFEPETVKFLKEIESQSNKGNLAWLKEHGTVYQAIGETA